MSQAERDEAMAGVGNQRHSGIADQRDFGTLFHSDDEFGGTSDFVVFVVANERLMNVVVSEQFLGVASVLASDLIRFFEDAQRAESDVLEIADGCGHEIQRAARAGLTNRGNGRATGLRARMRVRF